MKKILAVLLAVVMTFSMLVPASAAINTGADSNVVAMSETEEGTTQETNKVIAVIKAIYDFVHSLVHTLSEIFDFKCPFCKGSNDADKPSDENDSYEAVEISSAELVEILTAEIVNGSVTVELDNNYKVTDSWTSISYPVDVYEVMLNSLTVKGNGHVIAGLDAPLFVGNVARNISIENLTIADSNIANGNENDLGRGALLAYADADVVNLSIENCAVKNSTVVAVSGDNDGVGAAGALIGYVSCDTLSIKGCTAKKVNLQGKNAGGIVGFCMACTSSNIENCKVANCELTGKYSGQIAATVNGGGELKITNCEFTGDACDPNRIFTTVTIG